MSEMVCICDNCGSRNIKVVSWMDTLGKSFYFCNLICRTEFLQDKYPELVRKRDEAKNLLPEVRTLIAHKAKSGRVTIVRRDRRVRGGTAAGADQHKGSSSS